MRRRVRTVTDCTYCGSTVEDHDPVFLTEGTDNVPAGSFCNYACLAAYIDQEELTEGAACQWDPKA